MSDIHRFMPKLVGDLVPKPKDRGKWEEHEGLIAKTAEDLVRGDQGQTSADVLTAVPTPWARPLLFAEALADIRDEEEIARQHPLHTEVLDEWRGLLAMFCFQQQYGLNLTAHKLDLLDPSVSAAVAGRSLKELLPHPAHAWQTIYLIYASGKLIAGTSPLSLFFTASRYEAPVPWRDSQTKRLVDPLTYFRASGIDNWKEQLATLSAWVATIANELPKIHLPGDDEDESYKNQLNRLLASWQREIDATGGVEQSDTKGQLKRTRSAVQVRPYEEFSWGVESLKFRSDCLLATQKAADLDANARPLVAIKSLWEDMPDLMVDQAHTIKDVIFPDGEASGVELKTRAGGKVRRRWINPEKLFFTDKVLSLPLSDKVLSKGRSDLALPFKKEIFQYFTPKELAEWFTWLIAQDGVVGELQIPIGGLNGGKVRLAQARRKYENEKMVPLPEGGRDPVLALWPDFKAPDWEHNYCYCHIDNVTAGELSFKPVDAVMEAVRSGDPYEGVVWRTASLTDGFECIHTIGIDSEPVGVIVPDPEKFRVPGYASGQWHVGIDFGTSNTTVAFRLGEDSQPVPVKFSDRVALLSEHDEVYLATVKSGFIKPSFMPTEQSPEWPAIRPNAITSTTCIDYRPAKDPQVISDMALLPLDCMESFASWLWPTGAVDVKANLKWARAPEIRTLIVGFLKHFLLLVSAEARASGVTSLSVHWSYPSAMPGWMLSDLRGKWDDISSSFATDDQGAGPNQTPFPRTGVGLEMGTSTTESEAVCRYFVKKHKARLGSNALITMDIGGGTTDVAIWQGGELRVQSSVLLSAGIVSEFLVNSEPDFQELITEVFKLRYDEFQAVWRHSQKEAKLPTLVNLMLRLGGRGFLSQLRTHSTAAGGVVPRMRSLVLCTFGSMAHLAGLCLKKLGVDAPRRLNVEVHLGGNGAKMLEWIAVGPEAREAMASILRKAAAPEFAVEQLLVRVSDAPKQEAAFGLLLPSVARPGTQTAASLLLGESGYKYQSARLPWHMDLAAPENATIFDERGRIEVPDEFPELMRFLSYYDEEAARFDLTQLTERVTRSQAAVKSAIEAKLNQPDEPLGPFFVEEVRSVLEDHLLGIRHDEAHGRE